jgi:hypothetical protein
MRDASGDIVRGPYFPAAEFLDYQEHTPAFEDVLGTSRQPVHWISEGGAERLVVAWMTANGFTFLGVQPGHPRVRLLGAGETRRSCGAHGSPATRVVP